MIWTDTREQKNGHILTFFDQCGVIHEEHKLDIGDYMDPDRPHIVIERKQSLDELATNLLTKDKERFWREIRRAAKQGVKIIVLCEHGRGIWQARDIVRWRSRFSKITGPMLLREIERVQNGYGARFVFCPKHEMGRRILDGLYHDRGDKGREPDAGRCAALRADPGQVGAGPLPISR